MTTCCSPRRNVPWPPQSQHESQDGRPSPRAGGWTRQTCGQTSGRPRQDHRQGVAGQAPQAWDETHPGRSRDTAKSETTTGGIHGSCYAHIHCGHTGLLHIHHSQGDHLVLHCTINCIFYSLNRFSLKTTRTRRKKKTRNSWTANIIKIIWNKRRGRKRDRKWKLSK